MEKLLKDAFNTSKLSIIGRFSGCIAKDAAGYEIDEGKRIFIKGGVSEKLVNLQVLFFINAQQTKQLVEGEFASLQALQQTNTVRVPSPIKVCHYY